MRRHIHHVCRENTLSKVGTLVLLVLFGVIGFAPESSGEERPPSYVAFKAGIYSPSASFMLKNVNVETTFDADTKTGFDGEIAFGHYVLPTLALELGVGYFKGTGNVNSDSTSATQVDFDVVPVILSAKAFIPAGPIDPYGEAGIGAYFTQVDVANNLDSFSGKTTFGIHAGGGVNVNVTPSVFIGAEGRYVWADPSIGGEKITLNSSDYSLEDFNLNGFTTTLVVGFGF